MHPHHPPPYPLPSREGEFYKAPLSLPGRGQHRYAPLGSVSGIDTFVLDRKGKCAFRSGEDKNLVPKIPHSKKPIRGEALSFSNF